MDKKSNNPQSLKKYTGELRTLIDNDEVLDLKKILTLQKKFNLTQDDIDKIESFSKNSYESAKSNFEFGLWDKALTNIEEAINKSPINIDYLELHYKIVTESRKVLGEESKDQTNLELLEMRIKKVNKKKYNLLIKESKPTKKTFNKLWFLLLLLLFIPVFLILKPKNKSSINIPKRTPIVKLLPGEILTETIIPRHSSDIKIDIIESDMKGDLNSFFYNLNFYLYSDVENINSVTGEIIWLNRLGEVMLKEDFSSPQNSVYYLNERIPISFKKISHRDTPSIDKVIIEIKSIVSNKGRERDELKIINTIFPIGISPKINFEEISYLITKGVTKDYLTLNVIVKNKDINKITKLIGNIEWINEYKIVLSKENITFITEKDVPLENKYYRVISKTIEIDNISQEYQINISEIK